MKILVEIILSLALIGAWIGVALTASKATRSDADAAVAIAAPAAGLASRTG